MTRGLAKIHVKSSGLRKIPSDWRLYNRVYRFPVRRDVSMV